MVICREFQRNIYTWGQNFLIGSVQNWRYSSCVFVSNLKHYISILTLGKKYAENVMFTYMKKNVVCDRYVYAESHAI